MDIQSVFELSTHLLNEWMYNAKGKERNLRKDISEK